MFIHTRGEPLHVTEEKISNHYAQKELLIHLLYLADSTRCSYNRAFSPLIGWLSQQTQEEIFNQVTVFNCFPTDAILQLNLFHRYLMLHSLMLGWESFYFFLVYSSVDYEPSLTRTPLKLDEDCKRLKLESLPQKTKGRKQFFRAALICVHQRTILSPPIIICNLYPTTLLTSASREAGALQTRGPSLKNPNPYQGHDDTVPWPLHCSMGNNKWIQVDSFHSYIFKGGKLSLVLSRFGVIGF